MSALVLTPKGHHTFDVEYDGKVLGSVWRYKDGWIPYEHVNNQQGYASLNVLCDTFDEACDALKAHAGIRP